MRDKNKTKAQLIKELAKLRQQIAELEQAKNERAKETGGRSEEHLREIIDCVKDGIVILDLTGKITTINKSVTEVAGYTTEDIVGKRLTRLKMFPPKSIATMFTAFTRVVSGQQPPPYEVEVYTKTGEKLVAEIHGSLLRKGGEKAGVVAVLRDVTERKQLEALLLRERETFVTILQHAPYGVVLLDKEGKYLYVNHAFTAITGYTLEDIPAGRDWLHKAYPEEAYRQKITALWKKDRRVGGTSRETSVVCKNGKTKEIEFNTTVLDDDRAVVMLTDVTERKRAEEALQSHQENLEALVTERTAALQATNAQLQQEITERKQVEEALRGSEERLKILFEFAPDAYYMNDLKGTFIDGNRVAEKITGYKKELLIGKSFLKLKLLPKNQIPKAAALLAQNALGKTTGPDEFTLNRKNGGQIPLEIRTYPIKIQGQTLVLGIARDITERKNIEDALKESEERFRRVVETMEVGLGTIDENGVLTYVNEYLAKMLGYSIDEMIGHSTLGFYYDEESRKVQKEIFKKRRAGMRDPTPYEVTWKRKDGQKVYSILSPTPLFDANGHYTGSFAIHTDITRRKRMEETLRSSEEKYRELINGMNDTAWVIDFNGKFIDVNNAAVEVLGYSREELLTMGPHDIDSSLDAENITGLIKRMRRDKLQVFETTHTTKDGKTIPVEIKSSLVTYQGKQAILSIARDITKRKQAEEAVRESESRFRLLVEHSQDTIMLHDFDGKIIDVNQHGCNSLGYTREELLGLSVQDIDQRIVVDKHQEKWKQMVLGEPITLEGVLKSKDGTIFPVEIRLVAFESAGRRLILGIARDITERVQAEKTIRQLAYHDALTGLPNRVLFTDRLKLAIAQAHRKQNKLAVMLLDLDHFKDINDTLGHSVGDQLLSSVGKRLTGLLRKEDTVSRMGGDEFFLLLPEINELQDAATIAQKVLHAFQKESFVLDDHDVDITTSIGVAIYPDDGEVVKALFRNADIALYQAKQKGRNNYQHYTQEMNPESQADE
jgi:diguanylate cyclase (GGDEF)-like protein/PAS domain S-box-containing protein